MIKIQKGFSVIELFLAILILCVIGFGGYYVYHSQHSSKPTAITNSSSSVSQKTQPNSGVVKYTAWSQVPSELQKAIAKAWGPWPSPSSPEASACPASVQASVNSNLPVVSYNNAYAMTVVGCDGGAVTMFANISGSWQDIASSEGGFSCSTIQEYNVPIALLEADNVVEDAGQGNGTPVTCIQSDGSTLTLAN